MPPSLKQPAQSDRLRMWFKKEDDISFMDLSLLKYLKQVARNTRADIYTAMEKMACNNSRWKAANQSKD